MPLETKSYDLEAEAEALAEEMGDHAATQADAPVGSTAAKQAAQLGQTAQRYRAGLLWACENVGSEGVTLAALTNGERHRVNDTADETAFAQSDCYVAAGVYDAPFAHHDPEAVTDEDYRETVKEITDLHPAFVDWMESKISELGRYGGEMGKSYRTLVLEKRIQNASQETSG